MKINVSRKMWLSIGVTAGLLALVWLVGTALAQGPDGTNPPPERSAGGAGVIMAPRGGSATAAFTYQGQLIENGVPANGPYDFEFTIYADSGGTHAVGASCVGCYTNVPVEDGLFTLYMFTSGASLNDVFNGGPRWLELQAAPHGTGSWQTFPLQSISPAPYAWGLYPGTIISGTLYGGSFGDAALNINAHHPWRSPVIGLYARSSTSSAVYGESGGVGVRGHSTTDHGVEGTSVSSAGGYFTSADGHGIEAHSNSTRTYSYGGYFTANGGYGVYVTSDQNMALRAEAGILGSVAQPTRWWGVVGLGADGGVWGSANDGYGVRGYSINYHGVCGTTGRVDNDYGLYTGDNLYSLNLHLPGAVMQVARNGGHEPLERGDVVVIAGMSEPLSTDMPPIIQVAKAHGANNTAVIGVVASTYAADWLTGGSDPTGATAPEEIPPNTPGPVAPGEYLLIVVQGPAQVKASALSGSIHAGDLLATAEQDGYAAQAAEVNIAGVQITPPGTVFGKALEPLEMGREGLIYVFVTLQ